LEVKTLQQDKKCVNFNY